MAVSSVFCDFPLTFEVLLLLLGLHGARPQTFEVLQTPGPVSVRAGETITLNCTLTGSGRPGGVKWFKELDGSQQLIYSQKGESLPQVTRVISGSITDFSISISSIRPEDAGIYYCVKYRGGIFEREEKTGKGTAVTVIATPSLPSIRGPTSRVEPGALVIFNCTSDGFSPRDIKIAWWKDGRTIYPSQTRVLPEGESISYKVWSAVEVRMSRDDVRSQLVCQIRHNTLPSPLEQSFRMGDVLRVPPSVRVETSPSSPVPLNATVSFTCSVENFHPNDTTLIWLENNTKIETAKVELLIPNWDGTSSLKSVLEMAATEERNLSIFTCLVTHYSQQPINKMVTLMIQPQVEGDDGTSSSEQGLSPIAVFWIGLILDKIVTAVFLLFLFLKKEHARTNIASKTGPQDQGLVKPPA